MMIGQHTQSATTAKDLCIPPGICFVAHSHCLLECLKMASQLTASTSAIRVIITQVYSVADWLFFVACHWDALARGRRGGAGAQRHPSTTEY